MSDEAGGLDTETPHATGLLAESPMPHLLAASHTAGQILGGRVVSQVSHALCHHHHHHTPLPWAIIITNGDSHLCLRAPVDAIRQQVWSGLRPGWGIRMHLLLLIRYPSFEVSPPCHTMCALPSIWGTVEYALYAHQACRYRTQQPSEKRDRRAINLSKSPRRDNLCRPKLTAAFFSRRHLGAIEW